MSYSIEQLLSMTLWPMTEPSAYGTFHICFMLIGFEICALLAWIFKGVGERGSRIILVTVGVLLALSEVYKQLLYYYCLGDPGYDWDIFPFQLCSLPMYLCLIAPFLKRGRLQQTMYSFMGFFNLLGGAISFFEPSGLLHSYWTLTLHSCVWHMLLVFVGLFLCFSGKAGRKAEDYKNAAKFFLALCVLAFCINLAFREISSGTINMFFVGPGDNPIIVFSAIAEHFGWFAATLVYIPAVCAGAYIVFAVQKYISLKFSKKLQIASI